MGKEVKMVRVEHKADVTTLFEEGSEHMADMACSPEFITVINKLEEIYLSKWDVIEGQVEIIGKEAVADFQRILTEQVLAWMFVIPEKTLSECVFLLSSFREEECMNNLNNLLEKEGEDA
jgi:hypothetical protein